MSTGDPGPATRAPVPLPRTWRPRLARLMSLAMGVLLLGVSFLVFFLFPVDVRDSFTWPQRITLLAMLAAAAWGLWVVARGKVVADSDGLTVVNMLKRHRLAWAQVVRVRFRSGDPWVYLDLSDGTRIAATGIQSSDGERARRDAAELSAVVAAMTRTARDD